MLHGEQLIEWHNVEYAGKMKNCLETFYERAEN